MSELSFTDKEDINIWAAQVGFYQGASHQLCKKHPADYLQNREIEMSISLVYGCYSIGIMTGYWRGYTGERDSLKITYRDEIISTHKVSELYEYAIKAINRIPHTIIKPISKFGECECCGKFCLFVADNENSICRVCNYKISNYKSRDSGFVYVFGDSEFGIYKIGCSRNPQARVKSLQKAIGPIHNELICTVPTPDKYKTEKELHARFAGKRKRGEWFWLDAKDIDYIKGLAQ